MNAPSSGAFEPLAQSAEGGEPAATRPLYWSVRRELWENRFLYIAPLSAGAFFLCGFAFSTIGMTGRRRAVLLLDAAQQRAAIVKPYDVVATLLFLTAFLVGIFYCVEALHSDRRDRSILFWKSLPVSDRITVLSKAFIPLLVLPLLTFAVMLTTQFLMMLWSTVVLLPSGLAGTTWSRVHLLEQGSIEVYGLFVAALWHAPVYGWLLLVSAWARRATFLWTALPLLLIAIVEYLTPGTNFFTDFLRDRFVGGFDRAFVFKADGSVDSLAQLTPGRFLATPGLWAGLAVMAVLLAAAVRLRRNREAI